MSDADHRGGLDPGLAGRLRLALSARGDALFAILQDSSGDVLRAALKNPHISEEHLLALLKRRDLSDALLKALYQLEQKRPGHRLKVALVRNPATPGPIVRSLLPHLHLFELVDLCFLPGVTPDQRVAAERAIVQRLAETELGNKITLARRATATVAGELLKEGHPALMEACLSNPRLKEVSILQLLQGPHGTAASISAAARHPRWKNRPNVRLAILKNRKTPAVWFTLFLPRLKPSDINNLLASPRLTPRQKGLIREELKKRGYMDKKR
ncbi:MAG: hypothetical protein C0617_02350 [Desulfuromonas sp.]|uniref:hypothetical protein n=1 Tax=Desulfuromonas sp. TaxID=892 RepID=UPI000CB9DC2C|nr:hypothetical protein [Desulfuromonas sp.]PLX86001.1 MAG: hypothetical protein C0617_02350 [Desulfuromonas sp.]